MTGERWRGGGSFVGGLRCCSVVSKLLTRLNFWCCAGGH